MKLKIISGGQMGVDQAALRAAQSWGIPTGGTMPLGWLTEDGPRPEFEAMYGMVESPSPNYVVRTEQNVKDADITLWCGPMGSRGFYATRRAAEKHGKPFVAAVMLDAPNLVETLRDLATARGGALTINVAGSRESRWRGIGAEIEGELTALFHALLDDGEADA